MNASSIENYPGLQHMVVEVLEEQEISYRVKEAGRTFFHVAGDSGTLECEIQADDEKDWRILAVTIASPTYVPKTRFAEVSEWILRRNFGLKVGAFHLDLDDGNVQFRLGALLGDSLATTDIVRSNLLAALHVMDGSVSEIMKVAFSERTVLEVMQEADRQNTEEEAVPGTSLQ
jgi:hypothetical protein